MHRRHLISHNRDGLGAHMRTVASWSSCGILLAFMGCSGSESSQLASRTSALGATRSGWQMHDGLEVTSANPLGLIPFACTPALHGDVCEYAVATIPPRGETPHGGGGGGGAPPRAPATSVT